VEVRQTSPGNTSILVRAAEFAGHLAGTWRQRQRARAQDAFVGLWKEAWVQGCESAWAGGRPEVPRRLNGTQRAAWTAGWTWAQKQPDRRQSSREIAKVGGRRRADIRRPLVNAAKGGAAGLLAFAAARWLMGARRAVGRTATPDPPAE
jgi:hypothetical protein